MKNKDGHLVSIKERAEAIAGYLQEQHWKNDTQNGTPGNDILFPNVINDDSEFMLEKLDWAIEYSENSKQPGPDKVIMELL